MPMRRSPSILDSFNFAFEGIIHVLRTQRNMRVHFAVAIVVLVAAVWVGVAKLELIALLLAIAFVFITEMVNSALEQAIDVATTSFDPLAKLAKDVAAGAVLIATVNAVAIGYLVFAGEVSERSSRLLDRPILRGAIVGDVGARHPISVPLRVLQNTSQCPGHLGSEANT